MIFMRKVFIFSISVISSAASAQNCTSSVIGNQVYTQCQQQPSVPAPTYPSAPAPAAGLDMNTIIQMGILRRQQQILEQQQIEQQQQVDQKRSFEQRQQEIESERQGKVDATPKIRGRGAAQDRYQSRFFMAGFLIRSAAVCAGDGKRTSDAAFAVISTPELKAIMTAFKQRAENWMEEGAETFNTGIMEDGLKSACAFAEKMRTNALAIVQKQPK